MRCAAKLPRALQSCLLLLLLPPLLPPPPPLPLFFDPSSAVSDLHTLANGCATATIVARNQLKVHAIDAYWLQRKIGEYFPDPLEAVCLQQKADETMATMQELQERECENKLVIPLDAYDKFDFIKMLLKNQDKIVYYTLLARAQNEAATEEIEEKMAADPKLAPILAALDKQSTKLEKDRALEERVRCARPAATPAAPS